MMPKKLLIPACLTFAALLTMAFTFYSFQQRVSALETSYQELGDDSNQANIYNRARCLTPELVNQSLTAIKGVQAHLMQSLLISSRIESVQNDSLKTLVTRGIDCQLTGKKNRLLTWPISSVSAEQNNDFSASTEQLVDFIQAFDTFEKMSESRQQLINPTNSSIDTLLYNNLLAKLYESEFTSPLPKKQFFILGTIDIPPIEKGFSDNINEHIFSSINVINSQLKQQLLIGTEWISALQQSIISSTNINRLAQWIYWVDDLPARCESTVNRLQPLLRTASTSPILLAHNKSGNVTFSLNQRAINNCPTTAETIVNNIDEGLTSTPLLLEARGVSSGLVSSEWLTIASSLEKLAKQPFIVHSVLVEKSPKRFVCRPTTTDWDDQAAKLMEKYSQEAVRFLADDSQKIFIDDNQRIEKNLINSKLASLINSLGNTAQKNLSITSSVTVDGKINETAQTSNHFSQFSPPFTSAMKNAESLNVNSSLTELKRCVDSYAINQFSQLFSLIEEYQLFIPPRIDTSESTSDNSVNNNDTKFLAFTSLDSFENWWEDQHQRTSILIEQSRTYISFISSNNNDDKTSEIQKNLDEWKNTLQEIIDYQNSNDSNQASRLYSIYKKTALMTKRQCDNFLENNSASLNDFGNDIFSRSRREHILQINRFCE
jgi:hypothetical protein